MFKTLAVDGQLIDGLATRENPVSQRMPFPADYTVRPICPLLSVRIDQGSYNANDYK
jgi:hypothetical protein